MKGKRAIVTGAASGLGRATAIMLAANGVQVNLMDRDETGIAETAETITSTGGTCSTHLLDVADPDACQRAVDAAAAAMGGLDILCNIAGIVLFSHLAETEAAVWQRVFAVNTHGPFYMSKAAMPHLLQSQGAIVNVASSSALMGHAYMAAYTASKAAVVSMTQSLAMEFIKEQVRINAVAPGGIDTPLARNVHLPAGADLELVQRYKPVRGHATAEEVAEMIVFLASDRAAAVHGAVMVVDGGLTVG